MLGITHTHTHVHTHTYTHTHTHTQLLGIGLIAGGSVLVATGRGLEVFNGVFSAVGISAIIIVVGIFTFIISAIAILGAIFKSRILLGIVSCMKP